MRCLAAETHGRWCRDIAARDSGILREHQCQHLFIGVSGAGKGIEYEVRCTAQRVISQTDNSKTEGDGEHAEGVARSSSCDCTHNTGEKSERGGDVKMTAQTKKIFANIGFSYLVFMCVSHWPIVTIRLV